MSASAHPDVMDKLVSLCKRRGFIFQSSEIYGGTGSVWDYGPLGVELKKNLKDLWWTSMVRMRDDAACWVMPRSSAAALRLPDRATSTSSSRARSSGTWDPNTGLA